MESLIRTVNDNTKCDYKNMLYNKFPKLMAVSSLEVNIIWLNVFPKKNGIYKTLSTSEIVLGKPNTDATHATLQPGSYVHCKIKARSKNNKKTRSLAEIILRRSNKWDSH